MNPEDLQFLKDEYRESQRLLCEIKEDRYMASFYRGQKRGLETALVRLGVLNHELDKITQEAYHEVMAE